MKQIRKEATELRDKGYSYNMIKDRLGVSISTQSGWFSERPFSPNLELISRIKNGPMKNGQLRHNEKINNIVAITKQAEKDIGRLSKRDLWMVGLGLYMGEGSKSIESVRIVNSDPNIIRLSMRWFREICLLNNDNFSLSVNLYPDVDESEAKKYWANITDLPLSCFKKTQIDKRLGKKNILASKLPYGTLQIRVRANGNASKGVVLFRMIKGWSTAIFNQV